jgi:hypothetical protein
MTFDTDDREYDHGRRLRCIGAAEAYDTPFIRELNNGAHGGGPAIVRTLSGTDPLPRCTRTGAFRK